ncbi:MAG: pknB 19 [Phycisphaerales bacterium]|nr:pknB 19 [Phycisphaerales bacterium]
MTDAADTTPPVPPTRDADDQAMVDRARAVLDTPPDHIGRYRILERLGHGGMGEVYVAEQTEPIKRRVALKVIKAGMDTRQVVARFEAERQALAMMDHPNIARVFDAGTTDTGRPYFVMELVRGVPITQFCDDARLSTRQRIELLVPVCQAVQHAHQKGIIHRDIKPSNVLVTLHDGKPVPKVIDFGIAKATGPSLTDKTVYTEFRQMIGTPAYMSPEQAEMSGLDIDTRSDIYSLGVLTYELLTGTTPFDTTRLIKAGLAEIQRIIKQEDPPRPSLRISTLGDRLPTMATQRSTDAGRISKLVAGELDWIVMKALEKDRRRRYETANDLAADLGRHLAGESIEAAPPSVLYQGRKFARKHRGPLGVTAAVIVALGIGLTAATYQWRRAEHSTAIAKANEAAAETQRVEADKSKDAAESEAYIANLLLTQIAIAKHDYAGARERLTACSIEKRGWEWDFLGKQASIGIYSILGPTFGVNVSRDGKRMATCSLRSARVYDTGSLRLLREIVFADHKYYGFALSNDGKRLAYLTSDTVVEVCDVETGRPVGRPLNHSQPVFELTFSPDDRLLATSSFDFCEMVWNADTGSSATRPIEHSELARTLHFTPDSTRLITSDQTGMAHTWDLQTSRIIGQAMPHQNYRCIPDFSGNSSRVVTFSAENAARVFDTNSGEPVSPAIDVAGLGNLRAVAISPDGQTVQVCAGYQSELFESTTGKSIAPPTIHAISLDACGFSPDGKLLVQQGSGAVDRRMVTEFSLRSLEGVRAAHANFDVLDNTDFVYRFRWSGNQLFLRLDDAVVSVDPNGFDDGVTHIRASERVPSDLLFASVNDDAEPTPGPTLAALTAELSPSSDAVLVQRPTGELVQRVAPGGVRLTACAMHPTGNRLVIADDTSIKFYDTKSWRCTATFAQSLPIKSLRFTRDGKQLLIGFTDSSIQMWSTQSLKERQQTWRHETAERDEARSNVASLLSGDRSAAKLREMLLHDNRLSPSGIVEGILVLDAELDRIDRAARAVVGGLDSASPRAWRRLTVPTGLERRVNEAVMDSIDQSPAEGGRLWDAVACGGQSTAYYATIVDDLKDAATRKVGEIDNLNALGYAQYRAGWYRDAIATLQRPEAADATSDKARLTGRAHVVDWGILALSHSYLGEDATAAWYFERFQYAYTVTDDSRRTRYKPLMDEVTNRLSHTPTAPPATEPANQ